MTADGRPAESDEKRLLREAHNWLLGGGIAFAVGLAWSLLGWFTNAYPDFFSYLVMVGGAVAVFAIVQYAPDALGDLSSVIRFDGANSSGQSDAGRELLSAQAERDFTNYPLAGVSLAVLTHAHSVPLQLAASGGLMLIAAVLIYWAGAVWAGWRLRRFEGGIAMPAGVSVFIWVVMSSVQNQLVDRYLYVSVAIIASVAAIQHFAPKGPSSLGGDEGPRRR